MGKIRCLFSVFVVVLMLVITLSCVLGFAGFPLAKGDLGASSGESWAIIVGVSDYSHIEDLNYCDDDAIGLYNQIAPSWGVDHVRLFIDSNASKSNIHDAIFNWLAPVEDGDDTVLFFFSGHGGHGADVSPIDEADGQDEYVCPYDSLSSSWAYDIRDDEFDQWLVTLDSSGIVVILDTCDSGGFITMSVTKDVDGSNPILTDANLKLSSFNDNFAKDISKSGRVILTASAENESSWDTSTLKHGVFSYYILDALNNLNIVDTNSNNEISAEEIFAYAEPMTASFTTENCTKVQHPQLYDGYVGELPLLTTFTITLSTNPPMASLIVDGTTYPPSQLPRPFAWATNTAHTFNASSPAYEVNVESPHPYPNYYNSTWNITRSNATSMRVHFNYIRVEKNYDYVRVLDAVGNICASYSGNYSDTWSTWVSGNTTKIRLTSDFSYCYDGFIIDNLEYTDNLGHTTQEYARYTFNSWNDGNTSTSRTLIATEPQTYTANYNTEYYLAINSLYGSKSGEGWYGNGTITYANLTSDMVDCSNGTRRVFTDWSGDATGTDYTACSPIYLNASKTVTANWKTQVQVSFAASPSGAGTISPSTAAWVDVGSPVSISASASSGYRFSSWRATDGITITNAQSSGTTATVTAPGTITADFVAESQSSSSTSSSSSSSSQSSSSTSNTQSPPPSSPPPKIQAKTGNLIVCVKDASNNPLVGVTMVSTSQPEGQSVLTATTNSSGYVTFSNITAGSYTLQASKNSYNNNTAQATVQTDKATSVTIELQTEAITLSPQPIELWLVGAVILTVTAFSAIIVFFIRHKITANRH